MEPHPPRSATVADAGPVAPLRRVWLDVCASTAPQIDALPRLLTERLAALEQAGAVDETTLLAVAEDAAQVALEAGAGDLARQLSKRLRRAIYEFLLTLDALATAAAEGVVVALPPPFDTPSRRPGEVLIGLEEVEAAKAGAPPVPSLDGAGGADDAVTAQDVRHAWDGDGAPEDAVPGVDAHAATLETVEEPPAHPEALRVPEEFRRSLPAAADTPAYRLWEEVVDAWPAGEGDADAADEADGSAAHDEAYAAFQQITAAPADAAVDAEGGDGDAWGGEEADAVASADGGPVVEPPPWDAVAVGPVEAAEDAGATVPAEEAVDEAVAVEPPGDDVTDAVALAPSQGADDAVAVAPTEADTDATTPATTEEDVADAVASAPPEDAADDATAFAPPEDAASADAIAPPEDVTADAVAFEPTEHVVEDILALASPEEGVTATPDGATAWAAEDTVTVMPLEDGADGTTEAPEAESAVTPDWVAAEGGAEDAVAVPHDDTADTVVAPGDAEVAAAEPDSDRVVLEVLTLAPADVPVAPSTVAGTAAAHADDDEVLGVPAVPLFVLPPAGPPEADEPGGEAAPDPWAEDPAGVPAVPVPVPQPLPGAFTADLPELEPMPPAAVAPDQPAAAPSVDAPWGIAEPTGFEAATEEYPIASHEGFHLTDPGTITPADDAMSGWLPSGVPDDAAVRHTAAADTPPEPMTEAPAAALPAPASGWSVRQSPRQQMLATRMAQKRREEAVRAAMEAAQIAAALAEPDRRRRRRGSADPERVVDVEGARAYVEEHLRRKRGADAASLLQRVAQEIGGRAVADLALDSGDRCRILGQSRAATNCYLAGWRADPVYEAPLWRLADVCLTERDVELAVGYLERIAELMRSRGDDEGAVGVYRKIVTVAPERTDIKDLLRMAQTTGHLGD